MDCTVACFYSSAQRQTNSARQRRPIRLKTVNKPELKCHSMTFQNVNKANCSTKESHIHTHSASYLWMQCIFYFSFLFVCLMFFFHAARACATEQHDLCALRMYACVQPEMNGVGMRWLQIDCGGKEWKIAQFKRHWALALKWNRETNTKTCCCSDVQRT